MLRINDSWVIKNHHEPTTQDENRKQDDTGESRNPYKSSLGEQQTLGAQGFKNCQGEGRGFESRRPLQEESLCGRFLGVREANNVSLVISKRLARAAHGSSVRKPPMLGIRRVGLLVTSGCDPVSAA